ncbi:unnamed protein product [Durusdinium trenchii]|uniref:Uncharacterized protein n=1 Tax=Durusdinium trenchii TaxID=1381693 RepID=A0ABP0MMD4_9DINO
MLGKSRARRRWCLRSAIQISLLFAGATASGRSFLTSPSSQGRAARCQRRAFDVATGAAVGTTFALFYDWSLRRKWEQPYLEMRVIDAVINNQAELKERVANLTAVTAAEVDVNSASEGWTRIYEKDEAPEKLRWIYQSEALRIASSSEDLQDLVIDGRPWPEGLSGLISRRWPESGGVVCDVGARMAWEHEIRAAEAKSRPSSSSWTSGSSSSWSFEFRSYTNQEELNAMLGAEPGCLQALLLRPANRTSLQVNGDNAQLEDNFLLLAGLLQLKIRWRGTSVSPSGGKFPLLRWDSSEAILSSSLFPWQRTFDRPEAAERLRKDPWQLVAMVEVEVDGQRRLVAVVNRMGAGRLVFSEDS